MLLTVNQLTQQENQKTDYYLLHLGELSESKEVIVHTAVCNKQGGVILPEGTALNNKLTSLLLTHTLAQPIEMNVSINNSLNSDQLKSLFKNTILNHTELDFLNSDPEITALINQGCDALTEFPELYQKLSVLQYVFPEKFYLTLVSAYLSLILSQKIGEKYQQNIHAFMAGLIHDLSMMSLSPDLLQDDIDYSPQQWRDMHNHCIIGYEHLMALTGFPIEVAQAVLEHHEFDDGSGYPFAKEGSELGITGQIVAMVDACIGIYNRESTVEKLGVDALLPVLEMNSVMFKASVFTAALDILSALPCQLRRVYSNENMPDLISSLMLDNEEILHDYCILYGLITSVEPHLNKTNHAHNLIKMASRINKSLIASGLLQNEHSEWMVISCGAQQEYDYITIEYLEVMYGEIRWQVKQLSHLMSLLLSDHLLDEQNQINQLERGLLEIADYHKHNQHIKVARLK